MCCLMIMSSGMKNFFLKTAKYIIDQNNGGLKRVAKAKSAELSKHISRYIRFRIKQQQEDCSFLK